MLRQIRLLRPSWQSQSFPKDTAELWMGPIAHKPQKQLSCGEIPVCFRAVYATEGWQSG